MGFQLTIAEGKEAGREFLFEQDSVLIGRTPECDIVLYDPGISRKHARVFAEGEEYFVEDAGSSNGTKLNGAIVEEAQSLVDGDSITLGPVVLEFTLRALEKGAGDGNSTRILSVSSIPKGPRAKPKALPATASKSAVPVRRPSTQRAARPQLDEEDPEEAPTDARPAKALARSTGKDAPVARTSSLPPRRLTMVERARIKRENTGFSGQLKLFWMEASDAKKKGVLAAIGLVVLASLGGLYAVLLHEGAKRPPPKGSPSVLSAKEIEESFGLGSGVTFKHADMKAFDFEVNAPTRAAAVLHFLASDISPDEVVVTVNGADVGKLPADTLDSAERHQEILIPPQILKRGEVNKIIFDNTKNPPGEETWRISNVWAETVFLPEVPVEQLIRDASLAYKHGQATYETKDVGASNRYQAWKDFRTAWLMLEALPPEQKPEELYGLARDRMRESRQDLDLKCAQLMVEAKKLFSHKDYEGASAVLDNVKDYFPVRKDHPCQRKADLARDEMQL